jgi:hypothetical protein
MTPTNQPTNQPTKTIYNLHINIKGKGMGNLSYLDDEERVVFLF